MNKIDKCINSVSTVRLERKNIPIRFLLSAILLLYLHCPSVSAQELREMKSEEIPVVALVAFIDPENRGLLIVESTIPKLIFESNRGLPPGSIKEQSPGIWHLFLKPGTHLITIHAEGYLKLDVPRLNFQPLQTRRLKVTPKLMFGAYGGFDVNRPKIQLKYTPTSQDEKIFGGLDGDVNHLDFSSGLRIFRPDPGKHTITLNSGRYIWEKQYDIQAGQIVEEEVVFQRDLVEPWDIKKPGGLFITSEPSGAVVLLNQVNHGITPLTLDEIQPGNYQIEVVKDLYLAESRFVEVKSLDYSNVTVDLTPNFGRLKIESDPPEAVIWINNQQRGLTTFERLRFNAGKYMLRLTQNLYHDEKDTFEIKPGGEFVKLYKLKPQFGKVSINSEPPDAEVIVDGQPWGKTPLTRDKVLSGEHLVRLNIEYHFQEEATIRVSDGEHLQKHFPLRPKIGWLTIISEPSGANVTLIETNKTLGKTPLHDLPLVL